MVIFFHSIASILLLVLIHGVTAKILLPGCDSVGQVIDILTATRDGINRATASAFEFVSNSTSLDGEYSYPWGMTWGKDPDCSRGIDTHTVTTSDEYKKETTSSTKVGGTFGAFVGSYADSTLHSLDILSKHTEVLTIARTKCFMHSVVLHPGYARLDSMLVSSIKELPPEYTDDTASAYEMFFNMYPPHVTTRCTIGGVLSQTSSTSNDYVNKNSMTKTSSEASVKFVASIDKEASSTTTVNKEYTDATISESVVNHGGLLQSDDQWVSWVQSVEQFDNLACLDFTAISLSELLTPAWTSDTELHERSATMEKAITAYFDRPGCTDPLANNYDTKALVDDGSCTNPKPPAATRKVALMCEAAEGGGFKKGCLWQNANVTLGSNIKSFAKNAFDAEYYCYCKRDAMGGLRAEITENKKVLDAGNIIADGEVGTSQVPCKGGSCGLMCACAYQP